MCELFSSQEDMNLNEERRAPLREKDIHVKREMVVQYIGAASNTVSEHLFLTKAWIAEQLMIIVLIMVITCALLVFVEDEVVAILASKVSILQMKPSRSNQNGLCMIKHFKAVLINQYSFLYFELISLICSVTPVYNRKMANNSHCCFVFELITPPRGIKYSKGCCVLNPQYQNYNLLPWIQVIQDPLLLEVNSDNCEYWLSNVRFVYILYFCIK